MFKKLKDKLTEEMKQSPARLQASMQQLAQVVPGITNVSTTELSTSNDNFSLTEGDNVDTPRNTPDKYKLQAVDLTSYSSNSMGLSRTSSVNSVMSAEISGLFPIYEMHGSTYHLQSDMDQSASELDEHINPQLDQITKEQIYAAYRKVQTKYQKYRGRYTDLANYYREMERTKSKLESILVETQDKALRRIADLKEQCLLEQQAKAHLEEALRNDIEEKDHIIDTLNTKVKILQANGSPTLIALQRQENLIDIGDSKDNTENNSSELLIGNMSNQQLNIPETDNTIQIQLTDENQQLKNKLDKLENLLLKYKESLKRSKEKISEITQEKIILERDLELTKNYNHEQLEMMTDNLNGAKAEIIILKEKINEMQRIEEESAISLAENKLHIHRELEIKEEQIKKLTLEFNEAMKVIENAKIAKDYPEVVTENIRSSEDNNIDLEKYQQQEETIKSLNETIETYKVKLDEANKRIQVQNIEVVESVENNEILKTDIEPRSSDTCQLENVSDDLIDKPSLNSELESEAKLFDLALHNRTYEIELEDKYSNKIKAYESELEEKHFEIKNMQEQLSNLEIKNSKLIAELDNINCRIFDTTKECDKAKNYVNEVLMEKELSDKKLQEVELKYNSQLDVTKNMKEEIETIRQTCIEQEISIEQYKMEKENLEANKVFEVECQELKAQIAETTIKFNNEISTIASENEIYKNNIAESTIQLKNITDKYEAIVLHYENTKCEIDRNIMLLQEGEIKLQKLIEDNSKLMDEKSLLKIQIQNLTDMITTKNELIDKLKRLKIEMTKTIKEKDLGIKNLQTENNTLLDATNKFNIRENEYKNLEERLTNLSDNNDKLKIELEKQLEINENLQSKIDESNNLMTVVEDLRDYKEKSEMEKKELKNVKNELLKANQELQEGKSMLEERIIELEELSQVHLKEIAELKKEIENKFVKVEELNSDSELEKNRLQRLVEELQSQLHEKESIFINYQTGQSQLENENDKLRNETEKLREELITCESEQSLRMQQLVKEFQARLNDKDTEIKAALDQKFDWQKNYESELVQQYREQLKDFQLELTAKSEEIEGLKIDSNPDSNKEIEKLVQTIAEIKLEHANELKEADIKWRETLKQKCDQLETKHNIIVDELTNEWKKNKFTDENLVQNSEELENMTTMAMAAVQSNTGSFHSLQQTLINQRRELTELRKLVKLRQETLDDSTEIEYLRNILYEYMMGKETLVLARVIAAVVKFDQDQTNKILKKEEDKLTLLGSLGLT